MSRHLRWCAVAATTLTTGIALVAPTAALAASPRAALAAAPEWTAQAPVVGHTDGRAQLHLSAVLNLRDAAGAERLAAAVSDPAGADYRKFVTAAQWRARFAPTADSIDRVTGWLSSSGFTVTDVPANGRYITFDGTAAQAEKAFGTTLNDYSKAGVRESAPARAVTVPGELVGTLSAVTGLDTSVRMIPSRVDPAADAGVPARAVPGGSELPPPLPVLNNRLGCSAYYGQKLATGVPQILPNPLTTVLCGYQPGQIRGAYGLDAALAAGHDGSGTTVAVVDAYASPTILADAQTYARRNDPAHPLRSSQFSQILPRNYTRLGPACTPAGWYGEETLDVEAVHATAPGADILYVGGRSCDALLEAVNKVVDNSLADIITNSYGLPLEYQLPGQHETLLQAAAQGISALFSSGDNGDEKLNTGRRRVDAPASDPYATAVGGTALAVGSNQNYLFEQGWGTGKSTLTHGAWDPASPAFQYGGGGGISRVFDQPAYQRGVVPTGIATQYGGNARAVPDVAMVGDPSTGFLIGQSQSFPDGSVRYSEYRLGGTSLSSPLFAGVVAVAAQLARGPLGFLNPALYKLAGTGAFRDVNSGRAVTDGVVRRDYVNGSDASEGIITSLRTLNQTGSIYTRPGWDDVTGVGSPNGVAFLRALAK